MRSVLSLHASVLVCVCLFLPAARTIEVHEDVNESPPIGAHLRVNASIPHANATGPLVNERNVNDLPPPPSPPLLQRQREQIATTTTTTSTSSEATVSSEVEQQTLVANNFTAFPSNHKQHSGASTVHGQTSSPLTTEVVAIAGITSFSPSATPTPSIAGGLSSFRAANGHLYPARGTSSIVTDRSVQHQISGYRKRQLYASAAPRRNVTGSTDGHFTKEFVPSPEVIPFFNEENSAPGSPTTGTVDAPYPSGLSDGDSRWYAGGIGLSGHGYRGSKPVPGGGSSEESDKWEHKYSWTTPAQRHQPSVQIKFPQDSTPHFPSPKGKWKWIPEEETESSEGTKAERSRPADTPFSSPVGSFEEHHFGRHQYGYQPTTAKSHPYSFDRSPLEGTFSIEPVIIANHSSTGGSSESSVSSGGGVSGGGARGTDSTETGNGIGGITDGKLAGKEDAHLKSVSPWKKIIHVLSAAIPIGLLISALTPQVVYINPNATQPPIQLQTPTPVSGSTLSSTGIRQRSLGQDVPRFLLAQRGLGADPVALVKLLRKLNALEQRESSTTVRTDGSPAENDEGINRLMDAGKLQGCDWKLLCQLARQGMSGMGTDALHKRLWKIVNETSPSEWTGNGLGLEEIFRIIRDGDCDRLQRTCDQDT